eukprot:scaffold1761_cov357-Prasinococcus_capsulatus_cf.AAC.8
MDRFLSRAKDGQLQLAKRAKTVGGSSAGDGSREHSEPVSASEIDETDSEKDQDSGKASSKYSREVEDEVGEADGQDPFSVFERHGFALQRRRVEAARRTGFLAVAHLELSGRLHSTRRAILTTSFLRSYKEKTCLQILRKGHSVSSLESAWAQHAQPTGFSPASRSDAVSCLELDDDAALLLAGSLCGTLCVYDMYSLQYKAQVMDRENHFPAQVAKLHCPRPIQNAKWLPASGHQTEVAYVCTTDNKLFIHDLSYVSEKPTRVLSQTAEAWGVAPPSLQDLAVAHNTCLASTRSGTALLWDIRDSGAKPKLTFTLPDVSKARGAAIRSLILAADGYSLYGGSEGGLLSMWDLRGGSHKSGSAFSTLRKPSISIVSGFDMVASLNGSLGWLASGESMTRTSVDW